MCNKPAPTPAPTTDLPRSPVCIVCTWPRLITCRVCSLYVLDRFYAGVLTSDTSHVHHVLTTLQASADISRAMRILCVQQGGCRIIAWREPRLALRPINTRLRAHVTRNAFSSLHSGHWCVNPQDEPCHASLELTYSYRLISPPPSSLVHVICQSR